MDQIETIYRQSVRKVSYANSGHFCQTGPQSFTIFKSKQIDGCVAYNLKIIKISTEVICKTEADRHEQYCKSGFIKSRVQDDSIVAVCVEYRGAF